MREDGRSEDGCGWENTKGNGRRLNWCKSRRIRERFIASFPSWYDARTFHSVLDARERSATPMPSFHQWWLLGKQPSPVPWTTLSKLHHWNFPRSLDGFHVFGRPSTLWQGWDSRTSSLHTKACLLKRRWRTRLPSGLHNRLVRTGCGVHNRLFYRYGRCVSRQAVVDATSGHTFTLCKSCVEACAWNGGEELGQRATALSRLPEAGGLPVHATRQPRSLATASAACVSEELGRERPGEDRRTQRSVRRDAWWSNEARRRREGRCRSEEARLRAVICTWCPGLT